MNEVHEQSLVVIMGILSEMGREWEYHTTNNLDDDVSVALKRLQSNHEVAFRHTYLTIIRTRIQISNCRVTIDLCNPKSVELLKNALEFHEKLPNNYSCAACPLMRP